MIFLIRLGEVLEQKGSHCDKHLKGREGVVGWGQVSCILSQLCTSMLLSGLTLCVSFYRRLRRGRGGAVLRLQEVWWVLTKLSFFSSLSLGHSNRLLVCSNITLTSKHLGLWSPIVVQNWAPMWQVDVKLWEFVEQELHPSKEKQCDVYVSANTDYRQLSCQIHWEREICDQKGAEHMESPSRLFTNQLFLCLDCSQALGS